MLTSAVAVALLFAGANAQASTTAMTPAQIAAQSSPYMASTYTNWTVM